MAKMLPATTVIIALAALTALYIPQVGSWLAYDRSSVLGGELWRIVTGHLYHYSWIHLVCNLLPLLSIGAWIEVRMGWRFLVGCLLTAAAIGIGLLILHPNMARFGGLSGLDCAMMTYMGLTWRDAHGARRFLGKFLLILLIMKIGYEFGVGKALLANRDSGDFVAVPSSHLLGCLSAWMLKRMCPTNGRRTRQLPRLCPFPDGRPGKDDG